MREVQGWARDHARLGSSHALLESASLNKMGNGLLTGHSATLDGINTLKECVSLLQDEGYALNLKTVSGFVPLVGRKPRARPGRVEVEAAHSPWLPVI